MKQGKQDKQGKIRARDQLGGAMIEMGLLIALIALIALPAVRPIGIGVKYAVCQYAHGVEGESPDLTSLFSWHDGSCKKDDALGAGYHFK